MKEPTDNEIITMLQRDSIGRNSQLSVMMRFINSLSENTVLAIDGAWGTGKTVFVKQLFVLNNPNEIEQTSTIANISIVELIEFQQNYTSMYFNAWESDYLKDPLQAFLLYLIGAQKSSTLRTATKKAATKIDLTGLIKNISKDAINLEKISSDQELVKESQEIINRKELVHELIDSLLKCSDKKLLIVIDELDRCKPSFAVELLETIKHYIEHDKIVFLISTNSGELSHTIRKYYGNDFDGAKYLNRFYDYNVSLKRIDPKQYIQNWLNKQNDGWFYNSIPQDIAEFLDMSLREINSYYKSLKLITKYMQNTNRWHRNNDANICQLILVPLALGLKISKDKRYQSYVSGNNEELIRQFCSTSANSQHLAEKFIQDKENMTTELICDSLVQTYKKILKKDFQEYDQEEVTNEFHDVIGLISRYSVIEKSSESEIE